MSHVQRLCLRWTCTRFPFHVWGPLLHVGPPLSATDSCWSVKSRSDTTEMRKLLLAPTTITSMPILWNWSFCVEIVYDRWLNQIIYSFIIMFFNNFIIVEYQRHWHYWLSISCKSCAPPTPTKSDNVFWQLFLTDFIFHRYYLLHRKMFPDVNLKTSSVKIHPTKQFLQRPRQIHTNHPFRRFSGSLTGLGLLQNSWLLSDNQSSVTVCILIHMQI